MGTVAAPQTPFQSVTHPSLTTHLAPSSLQAAMAVKTHMTTTSVDTLFAPFMGAYNLKESFRLSASLRTLRFITHFHVGVTINQAFRGCQNARIS